MKPQTALPPYLAHADVAILPWRVTTETDSMSPLTVYEHLGMGLPVVAPPVATLRDIPGITLAGDHDAFSAGVAATGRSRGAPEERAAIRRFAAENTWTARLDRLEAAIAACRARPPAERRRGVTRSSHVSVVIPSYNHREFLGTALDSVAAQTLPAGDVVVVDDGSTDGSREVLGTYAEKGVRVVEQTNRGAHAAINRAIALSAGEYVAILNSDDRFEPTHLEHAWAVARDRDAGLVLGRVRLVDARGDDLPADHEVARWYQEALRTAASPAGLGRALRRHNVAVTTSNFFLHKELWRRVGGFRDFRYAHDLDFLLRAIERAPDQVVFAPELCGVHYRIHGRNTIAEDEAVALAERDRVVREADRVEVRLRTRWRRWRDAGTLTERIRDTPRPAAVVPGSAAGARSASRRIAAGVVVPTLGTGGLEEIVALLARSLPAFGVDTHVLCTEAGGAVADRLTAAGVAVSVGSDGDESVRRWRDRTGVEVASTHHLPCRDVERLERLGVPVVETVHNTYAWYGTEEWRAESEKRAVASAIVCVSPLVARYYARHTEESTPLEVVPNAVHPAWAAAVPRSYARHRLGVAEEVTLFVHVGRITSQKNVEGLLSAFDDVRTGHGGVELLLVGPAEDHREAVRLRRRLRQFRGAVRHIRDARAIGVPLAAADAFVSSSFYEGWSVAASEALWVGRPVVLTECGGAAELVGADR